MGRRWFAWVVAPGALCAALAGCGLPGDGVADGGARSDGRAADARADGSTMDARSAIDGALPPGDVTCGSATFAVRPVAPNVLVLLDRSCSMRRTPAGDLVAAAGTGTTKWEIAVAALDELTTAYASQVRWGLIYLPRTGTVADGVACGGTPVCGGTTSCPEVAPAPAHGPTVASVLGMISPFDGCDTGAQQHITPLDDGLMAAGSVTELHDATRSDVVLLVTDGQESCLTNDSSADSVTLASEVATLFAMRIKTAVVGFGAPGGTDGVDPIELNAMAAAGGLPATGATQYYAAMDPASLHAAFDTIIASTLSCTFALSGSVTDASSLHVFVNGSPTELARDTTHASGWDYDGTTHSVTLAGASCDQVHHGMLTQLDVIQSCPGAPPPPPPGTCHTMGGACATDADCCGVRGFACDTVMHVCQLAPG